MGVFTDGDVRGLEIVYRPLSDLVPYVRNARTHTVAQIGKLEASLAKFGWTTPILVAGCDVLAGHARLAAALSMQRSGRLIARHSDLSVAPAIDLSALSKAERTAYIIADNKLAQDAGWDNKLLRLDIESLRLGGFDLSLTGFGALEIRTLLGVAGPAEAARLGDGMRYQVVVECDSEAHQAEVLKVLVAKGLKVRPLIL
jgi:ParB-like chromosome segregation protein Spo0J